MVFERRHKTIGALVGDYNHWPIGGKLERFSIGGAQNSTISVEVSLGGLI